MNISEAETLLEKTVTSIMVEKNFNNKVEDLMNLRKAVAAIGEHNGLGEEKTNQMVLTATVMTVEAGNGTSFPLDAFWANLGDLTHQNGGRI